MYHTPLSLSLCQISQGMVGQQDARRAAGIILEMVKVRHYHHCLYIGLIYRRVRLLVELSLSLDNQELVKQPLQWVRKDIYFIFFF